MRIVSWNLGHQTRERPLKDVFHPAIRALEPDILVLNEYVDGPSRAGMKAALEVSGLAHTAVSESVRGHNQVLIAARYPLAFGSLLGPDTSDASISNFLHVHIPDVRLELVGLRVPAFVSAVDKSNYWRSFSDLAAGSISKPIIYIGDLNADPDSRTPGGRALASLEKSGWQVPRASGEWSYCSTRTRSRLDHAIVAPAVNISSVAYRPLIGTLACAGAARELYDHAPLQVEIAV